MELNVWLLVRIILKRNILNRRDAEDARGYIMALYEFDNNQFVEIPETTFIKEGVMERTHIQSALKENIDIISPDCLVISEEYSEWSQGRRRIDLLAIDKDANIVVIELKRDEKGGHMELQSLRYAAMISSLSFSDAVGIYKKYSPDIDAEKEILKFLDWSESQEDDFACDVRIVLVSSDFDKEITSTVLWLNDRNIDIRCVRLILYKTENGIIVDVQQIIPLPEARDYIIKAQKKSEKIREAKGDGKDRTKYKFMEYSKLPKNRLVLEVVGEYVKQNSNITYENLEKKFPKNLHGNLDVVEKIENIGDKTRYFVKEDEVINLSDARIAVCNQWGGLEKMNNFISHVKNLGFEVNVDE